jgi:hypothetical protein
MAGRRGHHFTHLLSPGDPVEMAAHQLELHRRGAESEGISRSQEWEDGLHQGSLPAILPVELIVYVSHRAPAVPEIRAGRQRWRKPTQGVTHPPLVNGPQGGAYGWCRVGRARACATRPDEGDSGHNHVLSLEDPDYRIVRGL